MNILQLGLFAATLLFTGDVEAEAEQRLLARYDAILHSDVVKVAHHGSRTSNTPVFVDHVAPDTAQAMIAVVSVGPSSLFGLPDEDVLLRWQTHGATVWTTVRQGAIWLRSDGQSVHRVDWR